MHEALGFLCLSHHILDLRFAQPSDFYVLVFDITLSLEEEEKPSYYNASALNSDVQLVNILKHPNNK